MTTEHTMSSRADASMPDRSVRLMHEYADTARRDQHAERPAPPDPLAWGMPDSIPIPYTLPAEERVVSTAGGVKGKKLARYDLIPAGPLRQVAEHYGKGAEKYEDRNWERGYQWSLSFAAMQRHAWQFWAGENNDQETGSPHLAAVAFHALALLEWAGTHTEFDDRP